MPKMYFGAWSLDEVEGGRTAAGAAVETVVLAPPPSATDAGALWHPVSANTNSKPNAGPKVRPLISLPNQAPPIERLFQRL
ncbi:hypothetical protein D3C74_268790 [compost metagenome]